MDMQPMPGRIKIRPFIRKMNGSGIIEGAVGMMLIVAASILAVLFLANSGMATYNKEKIGFVAQQASVYATTIFNVNTSARESQVRAFVNKLLSDMNVKASNTTVTVTDVAAGDYAAVSVKVSADMPTIMTAGFSYLLPSKINVADTSVAVKFPYTTQYIVGIDPFGGTVIGSVIKANPSSSNIPVPTQLSYWELSLSGVRRLLNVPLPTPPSPQ